MAHNVLAYVDNPGQLLTFSVCLLLALAAVMDLVRFLFGCFLLPKVFRTCTSRGAIKATVYLAAAGVAFGSLNCGHLAIPPAPRNLRPTKVFGIGLSRTGTTSLTVALNHANISSYHALPHLLQWSSDPRPSVNKKWADAYDGHTDIQASVVFKQLARLFPTAKFVYNRRPADVWGGSMFQFMAKYAKLWHSLQTGL